MGVWLVGGEEKNMIGLGVFSPGPPKYFLSKMERKLKKENSVH